MKTPVDVLLLEDNVVDAFSIYHVLRRAGVLINPHRVASRNEFEQELQRHKPDVVLAVNTIPTFDGLTALSVTQTACPDTPFVLVARTVHDKSAVSALMKGAAACVNKRDLTQLPPTMRKVIHTAHVTSRRKRWRAMFRKLFRWFDRTPPPNTTLDEQRAKQPECPDR